MTDQDAPKTKRRRGRPRKFAAQVADQELQDNLRKKDAGAAQPPVQWLLITVPQAAVALQVSDRTVYNLIYAGTLTSVKVGGSRRISLDAVKLLATTGTSGATLRTA